MYPGLVTMLRHRKVDPTIRSHQLTERYSLYVLDSMVVMQFATSIKKSDVVRLLERETMGPVLVTGPAMSAPAQALLVLNGLEYVQDVTFAFDRMTSELVPLYTQLTDPEVKALEAHHRCRRSDWPSLRRDDPIVLYHGFKAGTSVKVHEQTGMVDYRHIV